MTTDEYSNSNPSEVHDIFFLRVKNDTMNYPQKTERSGKWLIFLEEGNDLDNMWKKIKQAISEGKLGVSAKASTMKPNKNQLNKGEGVICVYTYNFDDTEDVNRIRQELEKLGVTWKMPYKLDSNVGKYRNQGNTGLNELKK